MADTNPGAQFVRDRVLTRLLPQRGREARPQTVRQEC